MLLTPHIMLMIDMKVVDVAKVVIQPSLCVLQDPEGGGEEAVHGGG